jgi:hypothetical protein
MAGPDPESTDLPHGDPGPAPHDSPPEAAAAAGAAPEAAARESRQAEQVGAPADVVRLLVQAVGTLPAAERDQVYTWLLGRAMAGPYGTSHLPGRMREVGAQLLSLQREGGLPAAQHIGQQVVPVRFSTEQHAQLRTWCTEHGFSMATVIRGLVARFLEGQLPARN